MKNLLILLVIGLAAYGGYTAWNNHRQTPPPARVADTTSEEPAPVPRKESPPTLPPATAPELPKTEPEPPVPVAPAKRLAPEGVFYVVQAFSIMTEDGVKGIRAGTGVKLIKDAGATLRVSDGQQEFDARREFLTNDLDIAAGAIGSQASEQGALAEWHQKQQAAAAANNEQKTIAAVATAQRVQQLQEEVRAAAEVREQRLADIRAQIAREEKAKDNVTTKIHGASLRQKHLNAQNEKIRVLQLELSRLGVAGASLERK